MTSRFLPMMVLFTIVCVPVNAQVANFSVPDTVCVNAPVKINNTSAGGSTYFWNFCSGSLFNTPAGANLGNIGGNLNTPTFMSIAKEGNNYYAFVTNNNAQLVRYSFGNSYLNTPTSDNLGDLGGTVPNHTEGVQVVQDINGWHVVLVGGTAEIQPTIVTADFGSSLANTPTATSWGNVGNMNHPVDLYITQEGNNWYGLTVNYFDNTITRFDFGNSVGNMPTGVNLGSPGTLDHPTGIFATQENGNWYVFITNEISNTISRLDFGNSLANTPIGVNLGNAGGNIAQPRDISIIRDCGKIFGLVVSTNASDLTRLDFASDITGNFTATSLNSGGNFGFPHCITTIFREGNDLYAFVTNASSNTLSRFTFSSCSNSSIASSLLKDPPDVAYNAAGVYTINLLMNESSPTQSAYCKNIVVLDPPVVNLAVTPPSCYGDANGGINIQVAGGTGPFEYALQGESYQTSPVFSSLPAGSYVLSVRNASCKVDQPVVLTAPPELKLSYSKTDEYCGERNGEVNAVVTGGTPPYNYYWDNSAGSTSITGLEAGTYELMVTDQHHCVQQTIVRLNDIILPPVLITNNDTTINIGQSVLLHAINATDYAWTPAASLNCIDCPDPVATPRQTTTYTVTTPNGKNCLKTDVVTVIVTFNNSLYIPTAFTPNGDGVNDRFVVKARGVVVYNIRIFNRWGQEVFSSNNVSDHWDGKFKDQLQPGGVYVYFVTYSFYGEKNEALMQKGTLTLVR